MPTEPQIAAAKLLLDPQPYDAVNSALTTENVASLHTHLRKYLYDHKKSGRYSELATKLAAARGIYAAQLRAVLTNVSAAGSKVALLKGEVEYSTQQTIDNELEFALFVLYEPIAYVSMGTKESEVAAAIRAEFARSGCYGDEYQQTRAKDFN
jgi:hypothetical protein